MLLKNFSPYEEDWEYTTLLQAAKQKEVIRLETYESIPVVEARRKLKNIFNEVISSNSTSINILKVPTAVGKTEILTPLERAVIGFPNHALKLEVSNRMQVEHLITPELGRIQMLWEDLPIRKKG